jgi:hypothetical protein
MTWGSEESAQSSRFKRSTHLMHSLAPASTRCSL